MAGYVGEGVRDITVEKRRWGKERRGGKREVGIQRAEVEWDDGNERRGTPLVISKSWKVLYNPATPGDRSTSPTGACNEL